jgi:hypothetical protein
MGVAPGGPGLYRESVTFGGGSESLQPWMHRWFSAIGGNIRVTCRLRPHVALQSPVPAQAVLPDDILVQSNRKSSWLAQ